LFLSQITWVYASDYLSHSGYLDQKMIGHDTTLGHQEMATLLWLSLDALAVLGHPKTSQDALGCPRTARASKDSQSKMAVS